MAILGCYKLTQSPIIRTRSFARSRRICVCISKIFAYFPPTSVPDIQLNLVRCLFGAVGTAVIQLLYNAIGAGWTSVLLTGMCIAASPLFWVIARYGPKWRAARREKKEARKARKTAKEEARRATGPTQ